MARKRRGLVIHNHYTTPANLKGAEKIAIWLQSAMGYFRYNWFWNESATVPY